LFVGGVLVVELKAVRRQLSAAHREQVRRYKRHLAGCRACLLINFHPFKYTVDSEVVEWD
jgi:hypothetical protein